MGARLGEFLVEPRDGDVKQARHRVNHHVDAGLLPDPNDVPCKDCGHVYGSDDVRHEYDHYLGYASENHLIVEAVCRTCHDKREMARRTHCRRGHERNEENTMITPDGNRECRPCRRIRESGRRDAQYWREYRLKRRESDG